MKIWERFIEWGKKMNSAEPTQEVEPKKYQVPINFDNRDFHILEDMTRKLGTNSRRGETIGMGLSLLRIALKRIERDGTVFLCDENGNNRQAILSYLHRPKPKG